MMKVTNRNVADRLRRHSKNAENLSTNDVQFAYDQLKEEAIGRMEYDGPRFRLPSACVEEILALVWDNETNRRLQND
tara:strand:+ start:419 stop:649 length:231 start_codon:yes stop_codon:yes gene_type:complete